MSAPGKYSRLFLFVKDVGDLFYLLSEGDHFQAKAFQYHGLLVFKKNAIKPMCVVFIAMNPMLIFDVFLKNPLEVGVGERFELTLNHNFLKLVATSGFEPELLSS